MTFFESIAKLEFLILSKVNSSNWKYQQRLPSKTFHELFHSILYEKKSPNLEKMSY